MKLGKGFCKRRYAKALPLQLSLSIRIFHQKFTLLIKEVFLNPAGIFSILVITHEKTGKKRVFLPACQKITGKEERDE